jgi:hypothetical protein
MTTVLRRTGALLVVVVALVHLNLYVREHYEQIPTVGGLFLLTVVSGAVLAVAMLARPGWLVDLSGILFAFGVLGGYLLTLWLPKGLFQFKEPGISYSGVLSIVAELGTAAVLAVALWRDRQAFRPVRPTGVVGGNGPRTFAAPPSSSSD